MNKVYLVEYFENAGETDADVAVEDAQVIGYFTNKKAVDDAIQGCLAIRIPRENVRVVEYPLKYGNQQQSVYVLTYEYYTEGDNGREEFYYTFPPLASEEQCLALHRRIGQQEEYRATPDKHFYDSESGFTITRYALNRVQPYSRFK